jgi:tetratricopeptide (TPR) repeat protein
VLLAEMLGWCDERVCQAAYEEQFFVPDEMQQDCERYTLLFQVLRDQWGQSFATIFAQAWHSETLEDCPSLTEWAQLLFASEPASVLSLDTAAPPAAAAETPQPPAAETYPAELGAANQAIEELQEAYHMAPQVVAISYARALLNRGALQEQAGIWQSAVEDYQTAQSIAPAGNLQDELTSRIIRLTSQYSSAPEAPAPPQGTNGNLPHALHDTAHTNALPHSDMSEGIPTEQYIEADNSEPSGESSYMPAGTPLEARAVGGGTSPKPAQASPTGAVGANQLVGALIAIAVLIALIALALAMGGGIDGSASYADSRDTGPAAQAAQVLDTPQSTATRIPTEVSTEVPRPSATAEPMLIVDERFVDNRNGWYVGEVSTGTGVRIIRDGVYVTQIWGDHLMWWETWETQEHNFFAQVDVAALTEGSEGGLVFGYQDGENFYYAKVSADGDYLIGHSVNAEWITLIGWVQHEAVHSGIETNTVMVERQGSSIRLYVNDVLVEELVDDTFMSGQVGILAGAGRSSEAEILLDNFYLWRLP